MPRQTRRSFAASAVALVGAGGVVAAQEATPEPKVMPVAVLADYIRYVWNGIDDSRIADLFDSERWDLNELQRRHAIWRDGLSDTPSPVMVESLVGDDFVAMAYCRMVMVDDERYEGFFRVLVDNNAKIISYSWMAQPA